tara:strand:+ start:1257 stop:1670 length:414 start_codon:yes stop_codon:yes gene_type:complete
MAKKAFVTTWNKSVQPRKQRKYKYNAPLHTRQKFVHVHLSPELRKQYGTRNVMIKKGDKVRIMRGKFAKKEGKVERVSLKYEKLYITGIENIKKDGSKMSYALVPSNVMVVSLNLEDQKRKSKLTKSEKVEKKPEAL